MHVSAFPNLLVNKSRSFLVKDSGIDQKIKETIVQAILGKRKFQGPEQQGLVEMCSNEVPIKHLCSAILPFVCLGTTFSLDRSNPVGLFKISYLSCDKSAMLVPPRDSW